MLETVPLGLFEGELFNNVNAFLMLMIALFGFVGATSGYASLGVFGVFIVFVRIAVETDLWIFNSLLYLVGTILMVMMGLQTWNYINSSPSGDPA